MENNLSGEFILNSETIDEKPQEEIQKTASKHHPTNPVHFFSSFLESPRGLTFAEQEGTEEILLLLRRHFVTNIPWVGLAVFLVILPVTFPFAVSVFPIPLPSPDTIFHYLIFYYLIILGFVLVNFSLWYFHTGLVTTQRLIDIDLAGILYRQISEAKNKKIEDVSYTQIGFVRSLFNYGDVMIQTAGAENNIEYDRVPRPSKVAEIIGDLNAK